jgi:hypothetical protein
MEVSSSPEVKKMKKKITIGGVVTKTAFVLGTVGIISYSVIKKKLLGNPTSKIKKGLLYATLAGVILYKCQGDKIEKLYNYASVKVSEEYGKFYELKKSNNQKIIALTKDYEESTSKNFELEKKVEFYSKHDSIINSISDEKRILMDEKNSLEEKLKKLEEIKNQNEVIIKKLKKDSLEKEGLEQKLNEEMQKAYAKSIVMPEKINNEKSLTAKQKPLSDNIQNNSANSSKPEIKPIKYDEHYIVGKELEKITDNCGGYKFVTYVTNLPHENIFWLISDGKITFNDISIKYYNGKKSPETIREYNRMNEFPDMPITLGHPIALLKNELINKYNVYKGGFPRSYDVSVEDNGLDIVINNLYNEDSKSLDVVAAIKKYNQIYGQDIDELKNKAIDLNRKSYSILIPRFLKYNVYAAVHEFWVSRNDESGEY